MKKLYEQYFRVECNFGCKYFKDPEKATAYYERKANKGLDVELWLVTLCIMPKTHVYKAKQVLLDATPSAFRKCE